MANGNQPKLMVEEERLEPFHLYQEMLEESKMTDIIPLLESFVKKAQKMGADEVEFFAQNIRTKTAKFETNNLKSAVADLIEGVGIRVLKNNSLGFASVNSFSEARIEEGLKEALAIAKVTPPEKFYYLSDKHKITKIDNLYDKAIESFTMDDTIDNSNLLLETSLQADSRVTIDSGTFNATIRENTIVNSNGINFSEKKSIFDYMVFGMAVDGDDIGSFDYNFDAVVSKKEIDVVTTGKEFAENCVRNLNAQKTEAFEGPAIFTPNAVTELFWLLVSAAISTNIQMGSSFLADKLGDKVAVDNLSIIDDGTLPNQAASSSFDREGVPHKKYPIIDKGVFTGVLYDSFTAHKEGLASTGHGAGSYRNIPAIWVTNLEILPGKLPSEKLISEIDHGVIINRISASPDPISGDFSASLKGAQLVKKGEITDTLKEITAVGNIFSNLNTITGISKDTKAIRGNQSWFVPHIIMDEIKFVS
ncbi:MAG: TldD/PmbA family protein [Asgard group archaeon]|nr:TldD/PmbA family protein [Asgard group archaeon]